MDRDAPFVRTVHGVADQRELISVRRRSPGSEIVVKMNGIAADLIRPHPRHTAFAVEFRAVQHAHPGTAQFLECRISNVNVGM